MQHRVEATPGYWIVITTPSHFARDVARRRLTIRTDRLIQSARYDSGGTRTLLIAPRNVPRVDAVDRDSCWGLRLELAQLLGAEIGPAIARTPNWQRELPLRLLTPLLLSGFPKGSRHRDVMRRFTENTQRALEHGVGAYLDGRTRYNVDLYETHGPGTMRYSHLDHFGFVYGCQIALVLEVVARNPDAEVVVVDLGTGAGHFLLTLAHVLAERDMRGTQVRLIGVDRSDADMRYGRALAQQRHVDVTFVRDDVADPHFPDRLRAWRPDVVVANHVVEHLRAELKEHLLPEWLLAARHALTISVPLETGVAGNVSAHDHAYRSQDVLELARAMELRSGYAAEALDVEHTSRSGLVQWLKSPRVAVDGGLSLDAFVVSPRVAKAATDPILSEDFRIPFEPARYGLRRRALKIGEIKDQATFTVQGREPRQVRQLVIKFPDTAVIVPTEFRQLGEAIQLIVDHFRAVEPEYDDFYGYLNVFRGTTRFSSYRGLSLNCHGDQMQTLRPGYAFRPDYSYIVSNTLPTIFFDQPFDLTEAVGRARAGERVNAYELMNQQADPAHRYCSENFGIYLLSPYVVHSASDAEESVFRVFLKVAFSRKRFFDNRELRRNLAFDYVDWYLRPTVGYADGFLQHAHWNERFLLEDLVDPKTSDAAA
jgi:hypothetical protein